MAEQTCKGLRDLDKANDYHLCLCVALMKALVTNGVLSQEELNEFIKDAAKEVASLKFALMAKEGEMKGDISEFVRAVRM